MKKSNALIAIVFGTSILVASIAQAQLSTVRPHQLQDIVPDHLKNADVADPSEYTDEIEGQFFFALDIPVEVEKTEYEEQIVWEDCLVYDATTCTYRLMKSPRTINRPYKLKKTEYQKQLLCRKVTLRLADLRNALNCEECGPAGEPSLLPFRDALVPDDVQRAIDRVMASRPDDRNVPTPVDFDGAIEPQIQSSSAGRMPSRSQTLDIYYVAQPDDQSRERFSSRKPKSRRNNQEELRAPNTAAPALKPGRTKKSKVVRSVEQGHLPPLVRRSSNASLERSARKPNRQSERFTSDDYIR